MNQGSSSKTRQHAAGQREKSHRHIIPPVAAAIRTERKEKKTKAE